MTAGTTTPRGIDFTSLFFGSEIRPFLVGIDRKGTATRLVIHTAQSGNWFGLKRKAERLLRDAGITLPFRVRRHGARGLDRARSMEEFVDGFRHDEVAHDPTGAITRASRLVNFARGLRRSFGGRVSGVYWNSRWRTVYVVLNHESYVADSKVKVADLAEAERLTLDALASEWGDDQEFLPCLRLGFEVPLVSLVPVDRLSYSRRRTLLGWLRGNAGFPAVGALIGLGAAGTAATAADLPPQTNETYIPYTPPSGPAVSEPNGKLSLFGGVRDEDNVSSDGFGGIEGSYSVPFGYEYGAQFDGMVGLRDGDAMFGLGGHFFWRDPSQGLLGIKASYVGWDADNTPWGGYTDQFRIGGEGEMYLDQLTLAAQAGVQFGQNIDDGLYGKADLKWYASPDLALNLGIGADENRGFVAHGGFEYQAGFAGIPGLTLYADAAAGDDDYYKVYAGVRIYFGTPKSLIDRHRYDDPGSDLADQGSQIGSPNNATPAAAGGGAYAT